MNYDAHANIFWGALRALPEKYCRLPGVPESLPALAANYPDLFDDPTRSEESKNAVDAEWRRFIDFPPERAGAARLHFFPGPMDRQVERIGLYRCMLERIVHSLQERNFTAFIKHAGCLSHAMGDAVQPAHITPDPNNFLLSQMLPVPEDPQLLDFHYHTSVEAVTGTCGTLAEPKLLGVSIEEAAWRLSVDVLLAIRHCRRYIIPTVEALFAHDTGRAEQLAAGPVTVAAQLTLDALFSAILIAEKRVGKLPPVDLRLIPPAAERHDLVYGGAILDGNKKMPPNNVPVTPGALRVGGKIVHLPGLGVLPHSGMQFDRSCYMSWILPAGVFRHFTALAGLHAEIGTGGAVAFSVLLDGKTVWNSGRMTAEMEAWNVEIPLGEATELTLRTDDANEGKSFWNNNAYWGRPQLHRSPETEQEK